MGRPTKLTQDFMQRFIANLLRGGSLQAVCGASGISYQTYRNWQKEFQDGTDDNELLEFFEMVTRAESELELAAVQKWQGWFDTDWRAIATFLERRYPQNWSRTTKTDVTVKTEQVTLADIMLAQQRLAGPMVDSDIEQIDAAILGRLDDLP